MRRNRLTLAFSLLNLSMKTYPFETNVDIRTVLPILYAQLIKLY